MHCNKDYCIFRIDYFADRRLLNRAWKKNNTLPKQHYDRANVYVEFTWQFIKKLTNKERDFWWNNYPLEPRLCAFEEIREKTGIACMEDGSGKLYVLVPWENEDIIRFLREKKNILPKKELKQFRYANIWNIWSGRKSDYFRTLYSKK